MQLRFILILFLSLPALGQGPYMTAYVSNGSGGTELWTSGSATGGTGIQYPAVVLWCGTGTPGVFNVCNPSGGGGSGTVTSFSAGNFSPLFTTSVGTATTTPALTFTASTAAQNAVLAGPSTGGTGAYSFRALVSADIPNNAANTSGTSANLSGTPALPNGVTATTQTAGDNSTKLATTAYANTIFNALEASGSPLTLSAITGTYWNNTAAAYSFDLAAPLVGVQQCFGNYQARASAVSIIPSSGVTIYFKGVAGTAGSATGLVSGGAAGDFICVEATDSTTYMAIGAGFGTWTNH